MVANVEGCVAKKVSDNLNESIISPAFQWASDSQSLLYASTCEGLKKAEPNELPLGPSIQHSTGKKTSARTTRIC
jgi:hypothetical protein